MGLFRFYGAQEAASDDDLPTFVDDLPTFVDDLPTFGARRAARGASPRIVVDYNRRGRPR